MSPTDPTHTYQPDPNDGPTAETTPADSALDAGLAAAFAAEDTHATADRPGREEHVGAILGGKYKLMEAIGEGGMGSVYMALQTEPVKRAVAVKVIKAGMDSKAVLARFEAERQALAMMDHPNIARVLDAGTTEAGRPFFVMELVKGVPITQFCDERKLTPQQRLELFVPVCQAIQHAHMKGVIHRDIKPSNVLVALYDDRPVPKVIDFGIAKAAGQTLTDKTLMTGFGAVVGTPEYMSPEQASLNNLDIDTRSDVYALGVLLYELLTGTTPVDRKSLDKAALLEILRIVREVEAPRPSAKLSTSDTLPSISANRGTEPKKLTGLLRSELDWIVLKALEKDRARRYETANGFAADVQRYLSGEAVQAHPPSAGYRLRKFVRRNKGKVIAASLVLFALLIGVAGTTLGLIEARRQEGVARDETAAKEQARADEAEQRAKAVQAGDRAAASDAFSRQTIDRVIDGELGYRTGRRPGQPQTSEVRPAESDKQWQIYQAFYEREIGNHPSGERHEAAALRLAFVFAKLKQKPEAIRSLDGLIGILAARLQTDPTRELDLRKLSEALQLRIEIPNIGIQGSAGPRSVVYPAVQAELYEYQIQAKELLIKVAPKQPWPFAYLKVRIAHQQALLKPLYELAKVARGWDERNLPLPKGELPADLAQKIRSQREEYYRLLREAMEHLPDVAEDATWVRNQVNEAAMDQVTGVDSSPPIVRDEFLIALFKIELKRQMIAPSPDRLVGSGVGMKEGMTPEDHGVRLNAWEAACKEVPGYLMAETVAAKMKTSRFLVEIREHDNVSKQNQTPDHVRRNAELIATQRKLLANVRSRPAAFPTGNGVPLHTTIRESMLDYFERMMHLQDAIDLLADWKREQAEVGKSAATAEVLKRLKHQAKCLPTRFTIPNPGGVSKEQGQALAEETLRDYEELFHDRAVREDYAAVSEYLVVANSLSGTYFAEKRYEDVVRVGRAAFTRVSELPPQPKDAKPVYLLNSTLDGIHESVGKSLDNLKQYPAAVIEYDACIATLAKEPEVPSRGDLYRPTQVAAKLMQLRLLRAAAILHNGQPDEATAIARDALHTYWDVCGRLQSRPGNLHDGIKSLAGIEILMAAPVIVGELRNAKAAAQLDRWATDTRPILEQAAEEIFKRNGPRGPKIVSFHAAALREQFRQLIWESLDRGDTKQAIAYADHMLALKPDTLSAARIQMCRARLVALSGDHGASSKAAKDLLDAPTAKTQTFWFFGDAALCFAAAATACEGDDELREKYAAEGVRLLRVCWEKDPKELPQLARFPEFRPHVGRDDYKAVLKEIDAKYPPPRELAPPPKAVK